MSSNYNKGFRSIYKLNVHIIFVTKYRKKAINQEILERLHIIFKETLDKWECHTMNGKIWGGSSVADNLMILKAVFCQSPMAVTVSNNP